MNGRSGNGRYAPAAVVWTAFFILSIFGVLTIASSQSFAVRPLALAIRQSGHMLIGAAALFVASRLPFSFYRRNAVMLTAGALTVLLLLPWFGIRINGMSGWFNFFGITVQPSEFFKPVALLSFVALMMSLHGETNRFFGGLLLALLWVIPILIQPDFGTAAIYMGIFAIVYFLAGGWWRWLVALVGTGAAGVGIFLWSHPYALRRLTGFLDPESDPLGNGWHIRQFELAIARGGWFGSKLGGAVWSNAYLPFAYNDSAFATMAETLGFFGVLIPAAVLAALVAALVVLGHTPRLAESARLYILGAASLLVMQTLIHISVNLGLLPPTGLTLPLISYGGSSFVSCGIMLGIALSASRDNREEARA